MFRLSLVLILACCCTGCGGGTAPTRSSPLPAIVGRNGMHRYNNQDHSMLTAMEAVANIITGRKDKSNIWEVNTEAEYHEQKQAPAEQERRAA